MKKYVFVGGTTLEDFESNINTYVKEGYEVIPPVIIARGRRITPWQVLMILQNSGAHAHRKKEK